MIRNRIKYWWANFRFTCRYRIARTFHLEIPKLDLFQQKEAELQEFSGQFESAINVLTAAMHNIIDINDTVDKKIQEVDDSRNRLAEIQSQLEATHAKNAKVISNFKALLGSE